MSKFKIEIHDAKGNRYTLIFEGKISRDKLLNLLDLVELLGDNANDDFDLKGALKDMPKFAKLSNLVKACFMFRWFDSADAQRLYEQEYSEPIGLSTVSTYLARMVDRGFLLRKGTGNKVKYRLASRLGQEVTNDLKGKIK
ncbi:MAG: hypothetical protein ACUVT5_04735 [Candidatus Bathyarchaeales archaeon]